MWKERNMRPFEGFEINFLKIRNRWINTFGSILLDHDMKDWEEIEMVIDHLTDI